jgi:hypothetical protein
MALSQPLTLFGGIPTPKLILNAPDFGTRFIAACLTCQQLAL